MRFCYNLSGFPIGKIMNSLKPDSDYEYSYEIYHQDKRNNTHPINSVSDISDMLELSKTNEIYIIENISPDFYDKHPRIGESTHSINKTFSWDYSSKIEVNVFYKIYNTNNKYVLAKYPRGYNDSHYYLVTIKENADGECVIDASPRFFTDVKKEDYTNIHDGLKLLINFLQARDKTSQCIG